MKEIARSPINPDAIESAYSFQKSLRLMQELSAGKTLFGDTVSFEYKHHVKLNYQRMKRVYKTCAISTELKELSVHFARPLIWLVLTDPRCGDSAQSIPVMQRVVELSDKMQLKIIIRDDHPEIMDAFLTDGARSIPKLICLDAKTFRVLGTWGPRPGPLQKLVEEHKKDPVIPKEKLAEMIQRKYLKDKTVTIQKELLELLSSCRQ